MHDTTETTLDDGNFRIGVRAGSQNEYYYAEPVNLFTRKTFEWNNDKYAESLSKTYDAVFQYTGDDENVSFKIIRNDIIKSLTSPQKLVEWLRIQ